MKKITFIFLIFAAVIAGCNSQPKINISFNMAGDSIKKSLIVNFKNNTDTELMVLSMGRATKIGSKHPCGAIKLDDFTKISSHVEGDCHINRGSKLFTYRKIEPFIKIDYLQLKKELTNLQWFKDSYGLFTYMDASKIDSNTFPAFILIKAGQTTKVEYSIDSNLSKDDKGKYKVYWANNEEIEKTLFPKNDNKYKLGEALSNIESYEYYKGPFAVQPLIFDL